MDADTAAFLREIDKRYADKYTLSVRDAILSPEAVVKLSNPQQTLSQMKDDVNAYFDSLLGGMQDEQQKFNVELENATNLYSKISEMIKEKATAASLPLINPITIERNEQLEETIVISHTDSSIEPLIHKLVNISNYVADTSTKYKEYTIGSWLFSGQKVYTLAINPPASIILGMETAKNEIILRLDSVLQTL